MQNNFTKNCKYEVNGIKAQIKKLVYSVKTNKLIDYNFKIKKKSRYYFQKNYSQKNVRSH